jgi:hypothetical protein
MESWVNYLADQTSTFFTGHHCNSCKNPREMLPQTTERSLAWSSVLAEIDSQAHGQFLGSSKQMLPDLVVS